MMQQHQRSKRDGWVFSLRHAVVVVGGVIMATGAGAASPPAPSKQPTLRYDEVLVAFNKKYDTNRDGKLDELEFSAAVEDLIRRSLLKKYDLNHNGRLDPTERAKLRLDMEWIQNALLLRYDANYSGRLDEQEQAAANRDLLKQIQLALPKPDRSGSK